MNPFSAIVHKYVVLAMIPLTLFSGRFVAGCICPDGHFELFCGGKHCCTQSDISQSHDATNHPCCNAKFASHATKRGCCRNNTADSTVRSRTTHALSSSCCRQVELSPMQTTQRGCVNSDAKELVCNIPTLLTVASAGLDLDAFQSAFEIKPPVDRLALLQRFLI